MKENLENALVELITKTVENTGKATDFILAETPEYVQQLLNYNFILSFSGFLSAFLLIVPVIHMIKILQLKPESRKKWIVGDRFNTDKKDVSTLLLAYFVFSFVACPIIFVVAFLENLDWFKIWIAPKVYLVEYAAGFVK